MNHRFQKGPFIYKVLSRSSQASSFKNNPIRMRGIKYLDPVANIEEDTYLANNKRHKYRAINTLVKPKYVGELKIQLHEYLTKDDLLSLRRKICRKKRTSLDIMAIDFLLIRHSLYTHIKAVGAKIALDSQIPKPKRPLKPNFLLDLTHVKEMYYFPLIRNFISSLFEFFEEKIKLSIKVRYYSPQVMKNLIGPKHTRSCDIVVRDSLDPSFAQREYIQSLRTEDVRQMKRV